VPNIPERSSGPTNSKARNSGRSVSTASLPEPRGVTSAMAWTGNYGRTILVLCAIGAMAIGIYGRLIRIDVPLPAGGGLDAIHGRLMICGVFGTLIGRERAVAIALAWPYLAPALAALGTVALVAGVPSAPRFVGSAAVFTAASFWIVGRQPALFTSVLLIGAA